MIMGSRIEVSVIIPVYNTEKYIVRCVESLAQQTFTDFEIILIDDGSTDDSRIICQELAQKDSRIRVISKKNTGVSDTRNVGLKEARGKYISFVDSDDYVDENMLKKLYDCAVAEDADIVMCKYYIDNNGKISFVNMDYEEQYSTLDEVKEQLLYRYYTDNHEGLYSLCNKLIRKDLYANHNICFDTGRKRGEDAWFIFQCLKHARKVIYIPHGYYYYYQSVNSIMHKVYLDQYEQWVRSRKDLLIENEELQFDIDYNLFYKDFIYKVCIYCLYLLKMGKTKKMIHILEDSFLKEALLYAKKVPFHIRVLGKLIRKQKITIVMLIYRIWALK